MKKTKILLLIFGLTIYNSAKSQLFVNSSNQWYLEDCCYSQGQFNCFTYEYYFGDTMTIDNQQYQQLITNNPTLYPDFGEYYREFEGKVYMKLNQFEEEVLIYDFNLQTGEQIEIDLETPLLLEVISIDSIALNSGEMRKRIELGRASNLNYKTYWIEGIGSELSTMNTRYMFSFDCWNELNCYHVDSLIEYQLGDCLLTNSKDLVSNGKNFSFFPNPVNDQLFINSEDGSKIESIEIISLSGKTCLFIEDFELSEIRLDKLEKGIYLIKVGFQNNKFGISKIIKQ